MSFAWELLDASDGRTWREDRIDSGCLTACHPRARASRRSASHSKPDAEPRHELQVVGGLALRTREVAAAAEALLPHHTDVRRELAADLVTQAQTDFDIRQARSNAALGIVAPVEIGLQRRLQDQALGKARFVSGRHARGGAATLPDVKRRLGFEPV